VARSVLDNFQTHIRVKMMDEALASVRLADRASEKWVAPDLVSVRRGFVFSESGWLR